MSAAQQSGPQLAPAAKSATPEQLQSALDNSIWYLLALWHPLHIAVSSSWGGPASDDKRDWFAGAISDLLTTQPDTDAEDLECFLLQIMQDEFDCNVEDESEIAVARDILGVRKRMIEERTLNAAKDVENRWKNRGQMKANVNLQVIEHEGEWEGIDEENDDDDDEMNEAPQLVPAPAAKEKRAPEIDDDGFQKVVSKNKR